MLSISHEFTVFDIFKVKTLIATDEFKPNSALVILDFLIRHGFIEPDSGKFTMDVVSFLESPSGSAC